MPPRGGEPKSEPIKIRLSQPLLRRIEEAMEKTAASELDRQQFLGMLISWGLDRWNRQEGLAETPNEEDTTKRERTAGGL